MVGNWRTKWTQDEQDGKTLEISRLAFRLFPELGTASGLHPRIVELTKEAYERTDPLFDANEAVVQANGYVAPYELGGSD